MSEESLTRLVLIRHGESRSSIDRVVGGHSGCAGLTDAGRAQAEALRRRLERTGELAETSAFWTSVLPRAVETAEIIAPALGGVALDQHCDLCEMHVGEADGITWDEFEERYRPTRSRSPYDPICPGGESWAGFLVRAGGALRRLADDHAGQTVVVVCHGGVIDAAFAALGDLALHRSFDVRIDNASITEWTADPGATELRWRLNRFNDTAHLR